MKKIRPFLLFILLIFPVLALAARQANPPVRLEITGVNASQMPTVTVTANVFDNHGQPMTGLSTDNFALIGDLAGKAQIVNVENITDNNLPFAVVLVLDVSTSMGGNPGLAPIDRAKAAAHAFLKNIGPNDPVAIMTFSSQTRLVQDYTTDKDTLNAVIDRLQVGGKTALYQAGYDAIEEAAKSPTPRRAVVLLSDGAEYGGLSQVDRGAAAKQALVRGVPVYTIGLGYGVDRTYLQQLSQSTNGHFYESPTADQLTKIYTDLATLLRSQYVITLNAPLPLDGTQYNLQLEVTTPQGSADASAVMRAPIPVPIVNLAPLDQPISTPTQITADIKADDPITNVTFQISGGQPVTLTAEPYAMTIDPVQFAPGDYTLTVSATDNNGDTGTGVLKFSVAALPSVISLSPDLTSLGAIATPQTITVQATGQTPPTSISVEFNHNGAPTALTEPYSFTIDPLQFQPGDNAVTVSVTNAGGVSASSDFPFTVAALPPQISVTGLQDGQSIDSAVKFSVQTTAQESVSDVAVTVGSTTLQPGSDGTYTLDPQMFPPGASALVIKATTASGRSNTLQINFIVAALPPRILVSGLNAGETLSADRDLTLDFISQTPIVHVAFFVDGATLANQVSAPYGITIHILDYTPGDHNLRMIADNASGQSSTLDMPFSIAPEPAATTTAAAVLATQNAQVTQTAQVTGTQIAQASETANANMVIEATAAAVAQQATATGAVIMAATQAEQATVAAQATATDAARATALANSLATLAVQNTATRQSLNATATQQAAQEATATAIVQATASQQAALEATATAIVQATANSLATQTALEQQATRVVINATATEISQEATATQQAALDATATQSMQQTAESVRATQSVQLTATQIAAATATQIAQATINARATIGAAASSQMQAATRDALATANARARQEMQLTQSARATRDVQATATQQSLATLDELGATQTALALTTTQAAQDALNMTATTVEQFARSQQATATQIIQEATASAQATEEQLSADATGTASANATLNAAATQQQATQVALATLDTRLTAVGPTATPSPISGQAQTAPTPQPTLTNIQEPAPATTSITPIVIVIVVVVVLIILILVILGRRRR